MGVPPTDTTGNGCGDRAMSAVPAAGVLRRDRSSWSDHWSRASREPGGPPKAQSP